VPVKSLWNRDREIPHLFCQSLRHVTSYFDVNFTVNYDIMLTSFAVIMAWSLKEGSI
jgi:hypothetical protein